MTQEMTIEEPAATAATPRSEAKAIVRAVQPVTQSTTPAAAQRQPDQAEAARLLSLTAAYQLLTGTWPGLR